MKVLSMSSKVAIAVFLAIISISLYSYVLNFTHQHATAQPSNNQATAPDSIVASTIADMPKGSKTTVAPEAIFIDEAKKIWLQKFQPVGMESSVTVLYLENGTFEVELADDKLRWLKMPITAELQKTLIPVQKITIKKSNGDGKEKPDAPKKP